MKFLILITLLSLVSCKSQTLTSQSKQQVERELQKAESKKDI